MFPNQSLGTSEKRLKKYFYLSHFLVSGSRPKMGYTCQRPLPREGGEAPLPQTT
jgi:hypothetical protein